MSPGKRPARQSAPASQSTLQFRISEVSKMLGVSPSALRQWEIAGLTHPSRTRGGYRTFSLEQVNLLKYIQHLRVDKGLNIEAIRHLLGKNEEKPQPTSEKGKSREQVYPIGRKLRQLRKERKITLAQAASETSISPSFLSCLERGQVYASVSTLQKLSVFYKSSVLSLFESGMAPNGNKLTKLVRPHQRKKISNEPGVGIELLAFGKVAMEAHIFNLAPGTSSGGSYHHEGEEFIFMLSGVCDIWLDEVEHHLLREGDCLYFSSMQTHRWSNPGQVEAKLLWVNTPPTF
jgi:DNA-binding transcriptional MerR regulator/mannose-6-phosphate isomerase-like protein (cupin superfamily)